MLKFLQLFLSVRCGQPTHIQTQWTSRIFSLTTKYYTKNSVYTNNKYQLNLSKTSITFIELLINMA